MIMHVDVERYCHEVQCGGDLWGQAAPQFHLDREEVRAVQRVAELTGLTALFALNDETQSGAYRCRSTVSACVYHT
jgi:hypothetical protein